MIIFCYLGIKVTWITSNAFTILFGRSVPNKSLWVIRESLGQIQSNLWTNGSADSFKRSFRRGLNLKWTQVFKSASVYYDYRRKILLLLLLFSHSHACQSLYSLPLPSHSIWISHCLCALFSSRPVAGGGNAWGSLSRDSSLIFQQHVKSGSPASSDLPCEGQSGNQVTQHSKDAEGHAGDENAISLSMCLYLETRHRK